MILTLITDYLKNVTVSPDKKYSGRIAIEKISDPTKTHEIKVVVTVPGGNQAFIFNPIKGQV